MPVPTKKSRSISATFASVDLWLIKTVGCKWDTSFVEEKMRGWEDLALWASQKTESCATDLKRPTISSQFRLWLRRWKKAVCIALYCGCFFNWRSLNVLTSPIHDSKSIRGTTGTPISPSGQTAFSARFSPSSINETSFSKDLLFIRYPHSFIITPIHRYRHTSS